MLSAAVAGGGGRAVWAMLVAVQTVLVTVLTPVGCVSHNVNSILCSFEPLHSPTSVECDLSDRRGDSIMITANNLPASVRRVRIVNAYLVQLRQDALSALNTPENIHFENITNLIIMGNTPVPGQHQGLVSVTLNRIRHVRIETGSFSHWKEKTLNIFIANIDECNIVGGAIVSSSSSTNVVLENITDGRFFPGTFATTLGGLTLNNVTTTLPCKKNTFAGRIDKLSLTSVKFGDVHEGCFRANQTWNSLTVRSSRLGKISKRGLQGSIGDVRIEESRLGRIRPNGFDLEVSSLSINTSFIDVLATHALNVRASGWISILMSNITTICRNAFRHLNSSEARRGIRLDQLAVASVVNRSLRFADVKSLTLRELQFRIPCECKIVKQVRELFFGRRPPFFRRRPPGTLTKRERARLFRSAYGNIRCLHNQATPLLREYHCTNCHPRLKTVCDIANRNARTEETSSASAAQSWVPLVALFGCFLLLGAVITLLVIRHRRRSAPRRRTPRPKRPTNQRLTVADIQHPLPDLLKDGQQMNSTSQSPGGERPGEVPRTGATGSTVYSSVYANVQEATVGSAVCENVSGVANGDDQVLYKKISSQGQTRGEEQAGFRAESTQAPPLYAEVNKGKAKGATTSDAFGYAADSSDPLVYAQVNKTKARTFQRSEKTTHKTANTGTSGTEAAGNFSETSPIDDSTADIPVYTQVSKNKPDSKKRSVNKQAAHPELEQTPQSPVYTQVKKKQSTASSQTSRHDPSQQTWQPSDAPLYEVSRLAPADDTSRGSSPRSSCLSASGLDGYAVPSRQQPTNGSAPTPRPDSGDESHLYAGVMYSAAGSADSKENADFSEGLHYNALYGVNMSPTD